MFTGFSDATADMFWDIRFNNDREWFHTQKARFDQTVMQPVKALSGDLFDWFSTQYPQLHLNLHISRIYRDARRLFGRGPLKDHIWFSFQNEVEGYAEAPCFWFEVGCEGYAYGLGYWMIPADAARYRREIDRDPAAMKRRIRRFDAQQTFHLEGDSYARAKGHADDALGAWYNKRWLGLTCRRAYDPLCTTPELLTLVRDGFEFLMPYYQFADHIYRSAE